MNKKPIKICSSFPLLSVILPYFSGSWSQWHQVCNFLDQSSHKTWGQNQRAFKNLLKTTKYRQVHIYREEFDTEFAEYIQNLYLSQKGSTMNFAYSPILDRKQSYETFLDFLEMDLPHSDLIKNVYIVDFIHQPDLYEKVCIKLNSLGISWESICFKVPPELQYKRHNEWYYSYGPRRYAHASEDNVFSYLQVITITTYAFFQKCQTFIYNRKLDYLFEEVASPQVDRLCMRIFEVLDLIKKKGDLPEAVKESISTFTLYNSSGKFIEGDASSETAIVVESFKNVGVVKDYVLANFPKLEVFEVSLFGFSPLKLKQILELQCPIRVDVDMYETHSATRHSLVLESVVIYCKFTENSGDSEIRALACESLEVQFEEDAMLYNKEHHFAVITKVEVFSAKNMREVPIPETPISGPGSKQAMPLSQLCLEFVEMTFAGDFIIGFPLSSMQYLNLKSISLSSIVPKSCVEATLTLALNSKGQLLTSLAYLGQIPNFVPLVLNFEEANGENSEFEGEDLDCQEVKNILTNLDVISLHVTNAHNSDFITLIMDELSPVMKNWPNLRNVFKQVTCQVGSYTLSNIHVENQIPGIYIKHTYD